MVKGLRYDTRADLWCMGVLLVEMLFGILPFKQNPKTKDYAEAISALRYKLPGREPGKPYVSDAARNLIARLLVPQE